MKILGAIFALLVTASGALACPMTLCGAGGNSGPHPLTPPATPDPGSYFNVAGPWGYTNNGLQTNGGTVGAFQLPSTPTNSWAIILEGSVDPTLTYFAGAEYAISKGSVATALGISGNSTGQPAFVVENNQGGGSPNSQWWNAVSAQTASGTPFVATAGSGYAGGYFPFTMTGSGCARDPSGVWLGNGVANTVDPGFLCPGAPAPTAAAVNIPGDFARQNTNAGSVATTCAANSPVTGNFKVTAQVAVAHGVTPGMTYAMQGFTPSGYNVTYTALPGTTGTTLVGMPATATTGTCPGAVSVEGTAMGGTGGSITMAAISTTNPFGIGMTGVTANNGKHFCAVLGEDGANSNFPGGQFFSALDDRGNALAGAPALVPWLNQGTANFTGYTLVNTQSPSSPALVVTAMNPYPISAATFSSTTGFATFTTSTAPGFIPGSEFTVTGITSSGGGSFNLTYVATNPTGLTPAAYAASTTIWGQPLSGPVGVPATSSLTGASVMTGGASPQMVSVIMPNMMVWGSASSNVGLNAQAIISPYGTFGATGTGGVGTYALINNQPATTTFTATGSAGATSITASGTHLGQPLVPGTAITGTGISTNTFITAYGTGTGGAGTYTISPALSGTLSGSLNVTQTGALWSAAAPGNIFAFAGRFYFNGVGVAGTSNSTVAATSQAALGDFYNLIGATALTIGANKSGWGGSLANVSMLWGAFPQTSGGAPDTTALASLCKKTTDINTFAAANGLTVQSLYRLNDPGIWADSSAWLGQGYITNPGGSSATLNLSSTKYGAMTGSGTVVIAGPGIVGCPTACPTAALGAGPTYALTPNTTAALGSIGSPVAMTAGTFKPAKPIATNPFNGYIDAPGGVGTLHVTSVNALATATGTLGGLISNGKIDDGAGGTGTILNVTTISPTPTTRYPEIAIGSLLTGDSVTAGTHVTAMYPTGSFTGTGLTGTYGVDTAQNTGATKVIFTSGVLPSAANDLQTNNSSVTGTLGNNMWVTDGGVNITGDPLILTQANTLSTTGFSNWAMNQNYTPAFTNATGLSATQTSLVPGQQVFGAGITTPVSIIALGTLTPCATTGILACGTYILSNAANAPNFTTTPVALNSTGIQDGPAVAPGRALTIRDQGAGVPFPTTSISCSALGSCTGTGTVTLSGTFDTSLLGGTPTGIEAQISLSSGGPPVPGCSACAWTALAGYSATLSSGTVYAWKGSAVSIPASGGPLYVSVRAANGTTYATMPSFVKMGLVFDGQGEGQMGALLGSVGTGNLSGTANSYFNGLWGVNAWRGLKHSALTGDVTGPPVSGDLAPSFTYAMAGDAFSELQGGVPIPESISLFAQLLTNAFGWPVTFLSIPQGGVGVTPILFGNVVQNQTVDVGDGTKTTFCSASKFCSNASITGPLIFTAATQTGAGVTAKIDNGSGSAGNILTTSDRSMGVLEPGMIITGAGVSGSPTLVSCTSGCGLVTGLSPPACPINTALCYPLIQTWTISGAAQLIASPEPMRGDLGATPWPYYNAQLNTASGYQFAGAIGSNLATQYIKAGTFQISVNGTVVCQDNSVFAYNLMGGNCTGAGISSSFVNYVTGDYQVTFSAAPTGPITASWINIMTPDAYFTTTDRPVGIDYFGDGTKTSGPISSMFDTAPGGVSGHFFGGGQNDIYGLIEGDYATNMSGYSQAVSWLYGTRFPSVIPGASVSTPFINMNYWRAQGPLSFTSKGQKNAFGRFGQWAEDSVTKSTWTGTIAGGTPNGVMTLTAAAVGPMWEGEPIGIAGVISGDYIIDLKTGTWGANGSTYDIGNFAGSVAAVASATAMNNSAYYSGSGPAFYAGPLNDTVVQQNGGLNGISGISPHISNGFTGGRRVAARMAAATYGGLTNTGGVWNPPNASDPSLDRVKANATGCDAAAIAAPCFDVANAFQASHSATITGAAITVTGGIAAHDRPFVVGQAITCSGCTAGRFITSIDVPPSQDSRAGQGEVGQTFHMTANASLLAGPTTETLSAGCAGTSGVGSNCIDVAIQINTTNGTYGTAAALATCGANNLNGASTPPYQVPNGICQTNGIGSLVRSVRIGTVQDMWGATAGSVYDDGVDAEGPSSVGGFFTQNSAFTCNIVAAKVMQCVKGATYTAGVPAIGQWATGNTFIEYSDPVLGTGRLGTLMGSVGGQSLAFTAGSGYTNGPYTITGSCTLGTSGTNPKIDVTVAGGQIVNVYPSAGSAALGLSIGGGCTFSLAALGGGTGGAIGALTVGPFDGAAGIATFNTDSNMMGDLLYDNSGLPGNPLNMFFTNHFGGYFEPGLPVRPWGNYLGVAVSG